MAKSQSNVLLMLQHIIVFGLFNHPGWIGDLIDGGRAKA
jgi:hypothetical protein